MRGRADHLTAPERWERRRRQSVGDCDEAVYAPGSSSLLPPDFPLGAGLPFTAIQIDGHTKVIEGGVDFRAVNPLGYVQHQHWSATTAPCRLKDRHCAVDRRSGPSGDWWWRNFFSSEIQRGVGPCCTKASRKNRRWCSAAILKLATSSGSVLAHHAHIGASRGCDGRAPFPRSCA